VAAPSSTFEVNKRSGWRTSSCRGGGFRGGDHVPIVSARQVIALAGQRNIAIELVLVIDSLEYSLTSPVSKTFLSCRGPG